MNKQATPHVLAAAGYVESVLSGAIPANNHVRQACERHQRDMARIGQDNWPWRFDAAKAERVCRFFEQLPHVKGEWKGTKIRLEPHQCFMLASIFGWVDTSGFRRFTEANIWKPRKNAKSTEAAGIGLYMTFADGEAGAETYCGATSEEQARYVFRPAWQMVSTNPDFRHELGVGQSGNSENPGPIYCVATSSRFVPVIGKPGDGAAPHCAIVDEFHEHDSPEQYDTFKTGMGSRRQPLLFVISTAGVNLSGPAFARYQYDLKVLSGVIADERLWTIAYGLDEGDDWTDFAVWRKANPNFSVSVYESYLRQQLQSAMTDAVQQNVIKTKNLNVWCNARTAWMNMVEWSRCADVSLRREDMAGRALFVGLDLASRVDIAARVEVYVEVAKGLKHYYVCGRYYAPERQLEDPLNAQYVAWRDQSRLTVTDGDEIDLRRIQADVIADLGDSDLRELAYDPWRATQLAQNLRDEGVETIEVRPLVQHFSPAMKEITAAVRSGRLHHDGDPVLAWMVSNVVAKTDNKDEVYPVKDKNQPRNKIDGAVALCMAISRAMLNDAGESSSYSDGYEVAETRQRAGSNSYAEAYNS